MVLRKDSSDGVTVCLYLWLLSFSAERWDSKIQIFFNQRQMKKVRKLGITWGFDKKQCFISDQGNKQTGPGSLGSYLTCLYSMIQPPSLTPSPTTVGTVRLPILRLLFPVSTGQPCLIWDDSDMENKQLRQRSLMGGLMGGLWSRCGAMPSCQNLNQWPMKYWGLFILFN